MLFWVNEWSTVRALKTTISMLGEEDGRGLPGCHKPLVQTGSMAILISAVGAPRAVGRNVRKQKNEKTIQKKGELGKIMEPKVSRVGGGFSSWFWNERLRATTTD